MYVYYVCIHIDVYICMYMQTGTGNAASRDHLLRRCVEVRVVPVCERESLSAWPHTRKHTHAYTHASKQKHAYAHTHTSQDTYTLHPLHKEDEKHAVDITPREAGVGLGGGLIDWQMSSCESKCSLFSFFLLQYFHSRFFFLSETRFGVTETMAQRQNIECQQPWHRGAWSVRNHGTLGCQKPWHRDRTWQ